MKNIISSFFFSCHGHYSILFLIVFVITIPLSLNIHLFTQNTRLVSKVSCPAWPLPSLSTVVLIPSLVGSLILSEGTLEKKRPPFFQWSFNFSFQSISVLQANVVGFGSHLTIWHKLFTSSFSNLTHFSLTLKSGSSSTVKLTIDFSLHSYSPFIKLAPCRSALPHAQGISSTVGQTKNPQLDNAKVSQEWDRRSTKDALSLARRVHVTRSILPNLGNNTKDRTHWPHWSLLFFSLALFSRYLKSDRRHPVQ